jgi:hypothetical protein
MIITISFSFRIFFGAMELRLFMPTYIVLLSKCEMLVQKKPPFKFEGRPLYFLNTNISAPPLVVLLHFAGMA